MQFSSFEYFSRKLKTGYRAPRDYITELVTHNTWVQILKKSFVAKKE